MDTEIADDIMDELFWSPYVDSDRIGVTVKNGQAALIGTAASRFAANAAVQNAFEGGAKTVQTKLVLDDGSVVAELYRAESYRFLPNPIPSFLPLS